MRLISMKLKKDVKSFLAMRSVEYRFPDKGFLEDMFALVRMKGNNLPTQERIQKLAERMATRTGLPKAAAVMGYAKRKMLFSRMLSLPYFHAICTLKNPMLAVDRFVAKMRTLHYKIRQSQCSTCNLKAQCQFGQTYGSVMSNTNQAVPPNYKAITHKDCPKLPEMDGYAQFYSSMMTMLQMQNTQSGSSPAVPALNNAVEDLVNSGFMPTENNSPVERDPEETSVEGEDESDGHIPGTSGPPGRYYDGSHSGEQLCSINERFIDSLTQQQLAIFELGEKFATEMAKTKKGKFSPVEEVAKDRDPRKMESMTDMPKLAASQHGLPDEVFNHRLDKKTLVKQQNMKPEQKKKLLYILIDNSASMSRFLSGGTNSLYTRQALCQVFTRACVKRVADDGGVAFVRFFTSTPGEMKMARTKEEFDDLITFISSATGRMGGTNIAAAVTTAFDDIAAQEQKDIAKSEILVVTDCEDPVQSQKEIKAATNGRELNILDVAGGDITANQELKAISTKYYKVDERQVDVAKIVSLL